jgi:uracil-DNA glycosylase family 4
MKQRGKLKRWLETDSALGATAVPVRARRKVAPARPTDVPQVSFAVRRAAGSDDVSPRARVAAAPPVGLARPAQNSIPRPSATPTAVPAPAARPAPGLPGIPAAAPRRTASTAALPLIPEKPIAAFPSLDTAGKIRALRLLEESIQRDAAPYLNEIATRIVFGEGSPDAALMFIGEGPGAEEDKTGRPFVGRSGQLLDKMIVAMGLQRSAVYIANVVKLRAAEPDELTGRLKDRAPNPEEVARGIPALHQQIEIIKPKVIVTLGGPALKYVTQEKEGIMKVRGNWRDYRGVPVMPTYHPSFVLRAYTPENRGKVWSDLQQVMQRLTADGAA